MLLADAHYVPSLIWVTPFAVLLLCIAILPIIPATAHWWHHNRNKLLVAVALGLITCVYYGLRGAAYIHDGHAAAPGLGSVLSVLNAAVLHEFVPFLSFLFALYVVAGGISVQGDLRATPTVNTLFMFSGGMMASLVGTTGASMLLIRPMLSTNSERKYTKHTFVFFIFIVSNIGGCLLPIGDPPLFLGFLRGVPFFWTLHLWRAWAVCVAGLLVVYLIWDMMAYKRETPRDLQLDQVMRRPLTVQGWINLAYLMGVVAVTAIVNPNKPLVGTDWTPPMYFREGLQLGLVGLSLLTTPAGVRKANDFNYTAILEVACLFIGIFITMQPALEILHSGGDFAVLQHPMRLFWATGILSSVLDNAPTYLVFFEAAGAMPHEIGHKYIELAGGGAIRNDFLTAISLGAVFMGANTYIGNGPNFMVKSIVESTGVKMPSFFGYMVYSGLILVPFFALATWLFL